MHLFINITDRWHIKSYSEMESLSNCRIADLRPDGELQARRDPKRHDLQIFSISVWLKFQSSHP